MNKKKARNKHVKPDSGYKVHERYYCLAGVFPHNCSLERLTETLYVDGLLSTELETKVGRCGKVYDKPEEALKDPLRHDSFFAVYMVETIEDTDTHKELVSRVVPIKGFAPNGEEIEMHAWEAISDITSDLASLIDSNILCEYIEAHI